MARAEVDVSHAAISRALATLGGRARAAEVAGALRCDWEPFEAQMRRRMRCRAREDRAAYLCLARAGAEKVRFHLEATGVIAARSGASRRGRGVTIRARDRRRSSGEASGRRRGCELRSALGAAASAPGAPARPSGRRKVRPAMAVRP